MQFLDIISLKLKSSITWPWGAVVKNNLKQEINMAKSKFFVKISKIHFCKNMISFCLLSLYGLKLRRWNAFLELFHLSDLWNVNCLIIFSITFWISRNFPISLNYMLVNLDFFIGDILVSWTDYMFRPLSKIQYEHVFIPDLQFFSL